MLGRLFPKQFDNSYQGYWIAIWIFVPVVILRLLMGANSILFTRRTAATADGFPLDSYGPAAADAVLLLFAMLGLFLVLPSLLSILALMRYRTMIPLLYLFFLVDELGRKAILFAHPMTRAGAPDSPAASYVVFAVLSLTVLGFVLSLLERPGRQR